MAAPAATAATASDGSSARGEKERGNRAFASGQHEAALEAYAAALAAVGQGEGKENRELRATLHSNRAACHLQLKRFGECIEEATAALALNPQMIKALYRRAQACERLGELEPALRDLRQALHLDPHNRDVLGAARRVGEALQAQLQARSPVAQMLDLVRSAPDDEAEGERRRRREALMGLVGLASQEPQAAYDVLREADVLVALLERGQEPEERLLAFRLLAACCAHPEFVRRAFVDEGDGGDASGGLAQVLEGEGEGEAEELTLVKITLFLRMHKASTSASASGEEGGGSASGALAEQALDCWSGALRSSNHTVREAGLDALLWWSSGAGTGGGGAGTAHASVAAAFFAEDQPRARRRLGSLLGVLTPDHDHDDGVDNPSSTALRIKGAHALGRLLAAAAKMAGAEGAQAIVARALGDAAAGASSNAGEGTLLVLLAAFLADPALGVKTVEEDQGGAARRLQLAATPGASHAAQALAAEVLNAAASSESGRACLGAVLEDAPAALQALMAPAAPPGARVAAASAFTKLGLAAKALSSASSELAGLFAIAVRELRRAVDDASDGGSSSGGSEGGSGASVDRALEVLCCLVTRTAFKDELAHGSGRCRSCVPLLTKLAIESAADHGKDAGGRRAQATYGLSFVLASLCLSNDELRKEALRERDVSPEEYEQLQRIQQLQQPPPGPDGAAPAAAAQDEADPPERVQGRIKELVKADGVRALAHLARLPGVGARTQEQVAMALAAVATLEECRGLMVQQGSYSACLELGKEGLPDAVRARALHAVAKVLVTTNPAVLSDRQRAAAVPNLLWLCRWAKATNLQQFEALMALTNLAAADEGCLEALAAHKGVPCFQSLQYSEHPLVRRAATEAMCNLACHPAALKHLGDPEKLKIWLALAEAGADAGQEQDGGGDGDLPTARAAAGALAMASGDEGVAQALATAGSGRVWAALLRSGNPELVHRTAIAVRNMARFAAPRARLQEDEALGPALSQLLEGGAPSPSLPPPVLSALEEAKRGLGLSK